MASKKATAKTKADETDVMAPPKPKAIKKPVITVEKVKIVDDNFLSISFSKINKDGDPSHHSDSFERYMHPDLRNLFYSLRIHLALLCDYLSTQQIKSLDKYDDSLVEKFKVTSISIKPEEGLVITGHKITKSGKAVILNTPFTRFDEDDKTAYRHIYALQETIAEIETEVLQYLDGSKKGEDPQGKLDLPEPEENYSEAAR